MKNWAGNLTYDASAVYAPSSMDELIAAMREVRANGQTFRALGTRHSFSSVADPRGGALISTEKLNRILSIDVANRTVTVEPGVRYGELGEALLSHGLALHNLASLPHISVAGAVSTGTHGSGVANKNLSAAVSSLQLVTPRGELLTLSRGDSDFDGAIVSCGELGVFTRLTLDIVPAFDVAQDVHQNLPWETFLAHTDSILSSAYSVSAFLTWTGDFVEQIWRKRRVSDHPEPSPDFFGATLSTVDLHPIGSMPATNCTPQRGLPGPSHTRLPHFKLEFTPSAGDELQTEYLLPRAFAADALRAVRSLSSFIAPHLLISEIRTVAADSLWLSPSFGADSIALHFTWKPEPEAVFALLPQIESALAPFSARPHPGKLHTIPPEKLAELSPRHADYERLKARIAG